MERFAMRELLEWKARENRKPLIIRGARQVGKTWLMKTFGREQYANCVYINFENNTRMRALFEGPLSPDRLIAGLSLYSGSEIDPASCLLIFDEAQEVPRALTSLKYFQEEAPEFQIVAAGSLLGVALHPGTSYPVGKVEYLDLYPLSFAEFLYATERGAYADLLKKGGYELASSFHDVLTEALKQYCFVGGMPEAVQAFADRQDFREVREIQNRILDSYEQDFSKHAPPEIVPRIRMLWNSLPGQLSRENRKFLYGLVKEGARAREYELALLWLTDCGLLHKVHRVTAPELPLKAYEDLKAFKLFLLDTGLLSCMAGLQAETLLDGNRLFVEFKGALTEQFVLQQLLPNKEFGIYYWASERGTAEIDFLLSYRGAVIPIEVKAETNLQAKSLKVFREKYLPEISVRTSLAGYREEGWLLNLPLWAIETLPAALEGIASRMHG